MVGCFAGIGDGKYKHFNLVWMATNAFFCKNCKKYTKHIELTWREFQASTGDDDFGNQFITGFCDLIGISSVVKTITGCKFWKCCECGDTTIRKSSGEEI